MTASTLSVRVAAKVNEAVDICSYELVDVDGQELPKFSAGAHVDVHLPNGLVRQYSLCNDPGERHRYVIGVLRDAASRGGSQAMHELIDVGSTLRISEPRNHFPLAQGAHESLLLAGGIGVTPILSMAHTLSNAGKHFAMHYCSRSRDRTAFHDRLTQSDFADRVQFHFDDQDAAQRLDLQDLLGQPRDGVHLYVCGPKGFMDAVLSTARASGWPDERLHFEFFTATVGARDSDEAFDVKLARSGQVVLVEKGQTVVEALAAAGVDVPTSCEQGICGTCLTRVVEGIPDHRDLFMTPEEHALNDQFTPCCSRSKSALLVLEL